MARSVKYKFGQLNNRDDAAALGYFSDKRTPLISTLVDAVNVDVFDTESASRREGYESVNSSPGHSAFSTKDEQEFYFVSAGNLCRLNLDYTITLLAPLSNDSRVWMEEINDVILASNGTDILLLNNGTIIDMPTPSEQHEVLLRAARFYAFFNGVVYGATKDGITMSKAYSLLSDERSILIPLPNITMVAPVLDGVWVGTKDKVYWMQGGGGDEFKLIEKSESGVVDGAFSRFNSSLISGENEKEQAVVMVTGEGICIGRNGGTIDNISIDNVAIPAGSSGCCYVRESDGGVFFLVSIDGVKGVNIFSGSEFTTNERNYS